MKPTMYDFTTVIKILKLKKERRELLYSNKATDSAKKKVISAYLFKLTGNEIYLRF